MYVYPPSMPLRIKVFSSTRLCEMHTDLSEEECEVLGRRHQIVVGMCGVIKKSVYEVWIPREPPSPVVAS